MTYEEFKTEMASLFREAAKYPLGQVGFSTFTDKMADLADRYPEYDLMLEDDPKGLDS